MSELLFPQTDGAVGLQVLGLVVLVLIGVIATRRSKDLQLLVFGLGVLVFAVIAVQAVH